jgi:RNA polymerase sigma factor for flagellar operon FliA
MTCLTAFDIQARLTERELARYAPLVKRIAHHLTARVPRGVQVDDLIQAGMIGLLEALKSYDDSQGASFETYAGIRIRGAMLDEVRRNDWAPRSVHAKARQIADAAHAIECREGREASAREIAEELHLPIDACHELLLDARGYKLCSLEDEVSGCDAIAERVADERADVLAKLQEEELRAELAAAIAGLPERERLVMAFYYEQQWTLKDIGAVLGVSESRICQIIGHALTQLRLRFAA